MILTCPACATQYVVKDGAIPPQGRQVRCASCKHSWHQDPEGAADGDAEAGAAIEAPADSSDMALGNEPELAEPGEPDEAAPLEPAAPPADALVEPPLTAPVPIESEEQAEPIEAEKPPEPIEPRDQRDEFSPFAEREFDERQGRGPWVALVIGLLLIAAAVAAFWYLAPPSWKERLGIAGAGDTPLQLMMTHSDRQQLESGNELLTVSGRVINPTDESQKVPPIRAQLRSSTGKVVYSWTIAPPARVLPPGASAAFNSGELDVPAGGDELTITLGNPRA